MEYLLVIGSAFLVSILTLFSGFGLGTLLMPVFAIFFSVEIAIAATAVVHFSNNIFKALLVGRSANFRVVLKFGIPAAIGALAGAMLLTHISQGHEIYSYVIAGRTCVVTEVKLVVALLIFFFSLIEIVPAFASWQLDKRFVSIGGLLSGFFGGLSGHQGALRSAFLSRIGLTKNELIGTFILSALVVDLVRLLVYGSAFFSSGTISLRESGAMNLVLVAIVAAFLGSFIATRILKKVTISVVNKIIGIMLLCFALALGGGLI